MQVTPPHLISSLGAKDAKVTLTKAITSDFSSWDILELRENPRIKRIAHEALEASAVTVAKPRAALSRAEDPFRKLERDVATLFSCEDALLFTSRNQALFSLFSLILSEQNSLHAAPHATGPLAEVSSLTGASLVGQELYSPDTTHLQGRHTEFLFVETIHPLTFEQYQVPLTAQPPATLFRPLILDESLALGAIGEAGLGVTEKFRNSINFNFFASIFDCSFVLGQQGCFVTSSADVIETLRNRSRTYRSEMPIASLFVQTISETFSLLGQLQETRKKLSKKALVLAGELNKIGLTTHAAGPYLSIIFKKYTDAEKLFKGLLDRGIATSFGLTQRPLSNESSIRILVSSAHAEKDFNALLEGVHEVLKRQ